MYYFSIYSSWEIVVELPLWRIRSRSVLRGGYAAFQISIPLVYVLQVYYGTTEPHIHAATSVEACNCYNAQENIFDSVWGSELRNRSACQGSYLQHDQQNSHRGNTTFTSIFKLQQTPSCRCSHNIPNNLLCCSSDAYKDEKELCISKNSLSLF